MVLVYCENIGPRHLYIFPYVFRDLLGVETELTGSREAFKACTGPRMSYGSSAVHNELHFASAGLLESHGVDHNQVEVSHYRDVPVLFPVAGLSVLPFDPFAMIFYLVTRYEEYIDQDPDEHGRFRVNSSLAFRHGFLQLPVVNMVAGLIRERLAENFTGYRFPEASWKFLPSFDVDIAYAHLGKGFLRSIGGFARLALGGKYREIKERIGTMSGRIRDPYDNFEFQREILNEYHLQALYFILLGDFGKYDRNISYRSQRFRALIRELAMRAPVGIHPSYASGLNEYRVKKEIMRLEEITGKRITISRQHFLKLHMPDTYRLLSSCGITDDYSLGYSGETGFRAGTAVPFPFYDLLEDKVLPVKVHPFIFMDSALAENMKMVPGEAETRVEALLEHVKVWGGEAIGIWHNYALGDTEEFRGWQSFFRNILKKATV